MSRNLLIVISEKDKIRKLKALILSRKPSKVFLCPWDYNSVEIAHQLSRCLSTYKIEVIDFVLKFNEQAFESKQTYINFVHDIGNAKINQQDLKQFFAYPNEDFSLWWLSSIAEQNPYSSNAFVMFSKILTITSLIKDQQCKDWWVSPVLREVRQALLIQKKPDLQNTFQMIIIEWLRVLKFMIELTIKIITVQKFRPYFRNQKNEIQNNDISVLTMFPNLDNKKLLEGEFVNLAYGPLQQGIEAANLNRVNWIGMHAPIQTANWGTTLRMSEVLKQKNKAFFLLEEWVGLKDLFLMFYDYVKVGFKTLFHLRYFQPIFEYKGKDGGRIDFWPIFRKDFLSSFLGKYLIWRIQDFHIFAQLTRSLKKGSTLIHFFECHAWEKALWIAAKRNRVKCVGLQHASLPLLWMNYFHHPADVQSMPTPDYIGCAGKLPMEILLNAGWPAEKLFIEGGFRFGGLKKTTNLESLRQSKKNQIAVIFSLSPFGNKEFLELIKNAFNDLELNFDVLLKSHPIDPIEEIAFKMGIGKNNPHIRFTQQSVDQLSSESKVVIVRETSAIFWALQYHTSIIVPLLFSFPDLSPLSQISDTQYYARTSQELRDLAISLLAPLSEAERKSSDLLEKYFELYDDPVQYYRNIESVLALEPKGVESVR